MNLADLTDSITPRISMAFVRSGGPGGQNVNKVNTKVVARLALDDIPLLSSPDRARIRSRLRGRINSHDEIVVTSQKHRTQFQNRKAVIDRMARLILAASVENRKRVPTSPGTSAANRRIRAKKILSEKKRLRRGPADLE